MPLLFEPLEVSSLRLRNRLVMAPMNCDHAAEDGQVTERMIAHYRARAEGGIGLIIVECAYVRPTGRLSRCQLGAHDDGCVAGLRQLVDEVHQAGAKAALQIHHAGRQTTRQACDAQPVAPSAIRWEENHEVPRELALAEVEALVTQFGEAARRAQQAGFDAVEIHGAHGYLVGQFVSPYSNRRTDRYGGDYERRMQFPLEVIAAVRARVGPGYPLLYRISAHEYVEGGLTLEDTKLIAHRLQQAGIDVMDVSAGVAASVGMPEGKGALVPLAAGIKSALSIPVIAVGGLDDPHLAEQVLAEGKADLIAIGTRLLKQPDWPLEAARALGAPRPAP